MLRDSHPSQAQDFAAIEAAILPTVAGMLDAMLEAAGLARAGCDAEHYAGALRALAGELEAVTHELEAIAALASRTGDAAPAGYASAA
jgi:hypothetical protein